jgi:hypothetical protein
MVDNSLVTAAQQLADNSRGATHSRSDVTSREGETNAGNAYSIANN